VNVFERALVKATDEGHEMKYDPPANSLSRMNRYTCRKCGRAVLGNPGAAYGSATEGPCTAGQVDGLP
jgi:hypothetical protein